MPYGLYAIIMTDPLNLTKTEHAVLSLLVTQPEMYGLQLVRKSGYVLKRSSIYVLLGRLEDKGFVSSKYEDAPAGEQGPRRRLYRITEHGQRGLRAWERAGAIMGGVWA